MTFTPNDVAPWARTFDEYVAMFALSDADRSRSILGCGDGPSSFNSEATANGMRVVSVDPIYDLRAEEIQSRIDSTTATTQKFLADYPEGLTQGRYVTGAVPELPFMDSTYDLALCSHFLFLYSQQHDAAIALAAIRELCRVAEEVRIFPLLELGSVPSRHLPAVTASLRELGFQVDRVPVTYEIQKGGNEMMRITCA
jgi:hypothetical protein